MPSRIWLATLALSVLACLTAPGAYAQNLLTNGGFETGDFTGWTTGGNFEDTSVVSGAFYDYSGAQEGRYYAVLGPVGADGTLSQSFNDTAGFSYTVGFWLNAVGDSPSDFSVYWDGTQILSLTNPNTAGVWTNFTFQEMGTGHDSLVISFRDDPGYIALDNVSVMNNLATPEPSIVLLLGAGFLGSAAVMRLRKAGHR